MAIVFMDSFDYYTDPLQRYASQTGGVTITTGRYLNGIRANNGNPGTLMSPILPSSSTYILGLAFYVPSWSSQYGVFDWPMFTFWENGTTHVDLRISGSPVGTPYLTRNGTWLATSSAPVILGAWEYWEIKVVIHDSAGSVKLRKNGVVVASASGIDTRNGGSGVVNGFTLFGPYGARWDWYSPGIVDDLYVCDGTSPNNHGDDRDFLGDIRVEYLVPTGAGVKTQFTPSTGSNWQNVDEKPSSDTDYNSASALGTMDIFGMANLSGNGLVYGVQTNLRARKDDAGFRRVKPIFYSPSGSGDTSRYYAGSQNAVADTFLTFPTQLFTASIDTGAAWTVDEVNALQFGYAVGEAGMFTLDAKLV